MKIVCVWGVPLLSFIAFFFSYLIFSAKIIYEKPPRMKHMDIHYACRITMEHFMAIKGQVKTTYLFGVMEL